MPKRSFLADPGVRRVRHHRSDAGVARALAPVHLAAAEDLLVGGLQVEVELAAGRGPLLVARPIRRVLAHRLDAVVRAGLVPVPLALEDDLAVAGLEVEIGLAALAGKHGELAAHALDLPCHVQGRQNLDWPS
jgi:hypothetical protein